MPFFDSHIAVPGSDYGGGIVANVEAEFGPNFARVRRPFLNDRGQPCVTVNKGAWTLDKGERRPVLQDTPIRDLLDRGWQLPQQTLNATSLRKEQWIQMDQTVLKAARERLRAWADLAAANTYGGFNGMNKMTLEHEVMSDPGEAIVDMDGMTEGRTDSPLFKLRSMPLPITHSDFWFSSRRLGISRNGDMPLDTTMAEAAGRRVAEKLERTTIGEDTGITYGTVNTGPTAHDGTSTIYGYKNFPSRLTKTNFTAPTAGGWVPDTTYNEVLAALDQLFANKFYGPFVLYHSIDWTQYMGRVYSVSGGNNNGETLRTMLMKNESITDVRRLDFLDDTFTLLLVQMTSDVARAVNGMGITTVQWETIGGMRLNFKVMTIQAPQVRCDYSDNCGILHGTTE